MKGLTDSLYGQIRAIKDSSDSGSHSDSESDIDAPRDAKHSPLTGQSEESSHGGSDDEKHDTKDVSDTLSKPLSRRQS